jgi:hypothetical protein
MPSWLIDDPTFVYMILAALAVILGVAWWRTKQGKLLIAALVAIALIGGVWLLSHYAVTDAKRIQHAVEAMAAAMQRHDVNTIVSHTSRDFDYHGTRREPARQSLQDIMMRGDVTEVVVWDFEAENISRAEGSASMLFMVKPKGNWNSGAHYLCRARFVLEDGEWRMQTFAIFNPFVDTNKEIIVPGLHH